MAYIKIKVTADAKKEKFAQLAEDSFAISVTESAERNQANRRVLQLLRDHFGPRTPLRIVSGHHSASKILSVEVR